MNNNRYSHGKKAKAKPRTKCNIRGLTQIAFKSRPSRNTPGCQKKKQQANKHINEVSKQPYALLSLNLKFPTNVASTTERYEIRRVRPTLKLQREF